MSTINDNIKNATQAVIDWVVGKGYTTCAGTVTISDSTSATAIPVALCTGATLVGASTSCPLTYIPSTGTLNVNNICTSNGITSYGSISVENDNGIYTDYVVPIDSDGLVLGDATYATSLVGCEVAITGDTTVTGDLCVTGTICATAICGSVECALKLQPKSTCTTASSSNPYSLLLIDKNAPNGYWCQPTVQPDCCIECYPQFRNCTTLNFDMCCKQLVTNNICAYCNVYAECFIPTCLNFGNCNEFTYDAGIIIGCCSKVFNDGIVIGCCSFADRGTVSIGNNARTGTASSGGTSGDIVIISHIRTEPRDLTRNSSPHGEIKFYSCVTANTKLCDYLGMQITLLKYINNDRCDKTFGDTECPLALQGYISYYNLNSCLMNRCNSGHKDVINIETCALCSNCAAPVQLCYNMALWGAMMTCNNSRYGTPYCNFDIDCFKERMLSCTTDVSIGGFAGKTYCQYGECTISYVRDTLGICTDLTRAMIANQGLFTLVY